MKPCGECHQRVNLMECPSCGELCCPVCRRERATEKPMNEHAELLKEARELADREDRDCFIYRAKTIRDLADLVEQQDKAQAESFKSVREQVKKDNAELFNVLVEEIEQQDKVISETVAACKTCDEAIGRLLSHPFAVGNDSADWCNLRAARHLARCVAKLAKPKSHVEHPSPPTNWDRYHDLLDIMTTRGLSSDERLKYERFLPIIAKLDAEEGEAGNVALDDLVKGHERVVASIARLTAAVHAAAEQHRKPVPPSAPPVEVAMRLIGPAGNEATWQALIGGMWFSAASCDDRTFYDSSELATVIAYRHGAAWLVALGKQLGVHLVAVWKDGE